MNKILVVGVGAQGSTIAKRLQEEDVVKEIVCADYDERAAREMEKSLSKAKAVQLDARKVDEVINAGRGCDLIVNGLEPDFNMTIMKAALEVNACYQDMASGPVSDTDFVSAVKRCLAMSDAFKEKGLTALINTGSAPGFANILTREAVEQLDSCNSIEIYVYDGIWSKKFIPFWWSPATAFGDMAAQPIVFENGKHVLKDPFSEEVMMDFKGLGVRRMVNHEHEEPVTMGLLADTVLKGVRNVNFKYGGPGLDLAEYFFKMGLLSEEEIDVRGTKIIPMNIISKLTPPAPKYPEEIKAVLDEGMYSEEGTFLVRVQGQKAGRTTRVDMYANAPGLTDSFEKAGITHESYFTGQAAFLFTKMLVNDRISTTGVFPPEMMEEGERDFYLKEAAKLDLTVDMEISTRLF